ncbi:TfoX/Sxy family protein [Zeaxanthinibacter sp. PT1]|uniref:TfoX/Sxy family protein n=1 Tax=Zeaxanthinibacter TaxID=561554 RepID=UPI0023490AFE|nr:TfoX/Sxy family protein [Zeaxanthinibacter sp. PT1]MDC6352742.1 TfoX/Sxy family protein [Zeaxanthinibacter sp. PT1]
MAYDELLYKRIIAILEIFPDSVSRHFKVKNMFGGVAFLYKGKMTVGVVKKDLMVRVVPEKMPGILEETYIRAMDFTSKPMKEFIFVAPGGIENESELHRFVELGLEHARSKLNEVQN